MFDVYVFDVYVLYVYVFDVSVYSPLMSVVVIDVIEKRFKGDDGRYVNEDTSLPNPNLIEFDNLYLDMNGIIHPGVCVEGGELSLTWHDCCSDLK